MAVTPLQARCRSCLGDFFLFEIVDRRSTTCPRCGRILTDSDHVFIEAAQRADMAQRQLIKELGRIQSAHGVLSTLPNTLLRNVFEELNWERPFRADAALANEELALLDKHRARWRAYRTEGTESVTRAGRRKLFRRRARNDVTKHSGEEVAPVIPIASRIARQQSGARSIEQPVRPVEQPGVPG